MKGISNIGKALETVSKGIANVPWGFYWVAAAMTFILLILYFFIIPRVKADSAQKAKYRTYCRYGMLFIYLITILVITIFTRQNGQEPGIQPVPLNALWEANDFAGDIVRDLLNFVSFVPLGVLLAWTGKGKRRILKSAGFAFAFSLCVEVCQLAGGFGTFDVDDILFHVLGGIAGAGIFFGWKYALAKKSAARYCMRGILLLCSFMVLMVFAALGVYHFLRISGAAAVIENISTIDNHMESSEEVNEEVYDPDLIWHDGKAYRYNEDLITILCMGVDQRSKVIEQKLDVSGESGQADAIFLLVIDQVQNEIKIIGISRDTMTDIKTFDYKGNYLGESVNHLGLAYAFGDGKETSCQYMVDAVSNLFYGIPINAYAAFNMESVITINDAVGGVPVYIQEDLTWADAAFQAGTTVTLQGKQALKYTRWRDTTVPDSNTARILRQKQYIVSFMNQAVKAVKNDVTLPITLYKSLTDEMVTNIGMDKAVYLATQALAMNLDESEITMLSGNPAQGSVYDEFYVDDDVLYELVLNTFYTEEKIEGEEQ